jgi:hypothetical protein
MTCRQRRCGYVAGRVAWPAMSLLSEFKNAKQEIYDFNPWLMVKPWQGPRSFNLEPLAESGGQLFLFYNTCCLMLCR